MSNNVFVKRLYFSSSQIRMENVSLLWHSSNDVEYDISVSGWQSHNETMDERVHDEKIYKAILVWTITIMFTGILGNVLVISAVLLHRNLRKIENVFIVNLAVADMGVSLIVNTFCIVGIVTKAEFFIGKDWLCEAIGVICITCCACSMWSIAAIGVNRYVIICHWARYNSIYNRRTVPFMLLAVWSISFFIDLPNMVGWGDHRFDWKTMVCTADMAIDYSYTIYFSCMGFGVPLCFIIYSYVRIYYHAWKSSARLNRVAKEDGLSNRHTNDMRLARSLLCIVIFFIAMWAPYSLTVIIDRHSVAHRYIYIFTALLAHTNSSINCLLYGATNRNFRQGYMYFFRFILCRDVEFSAMVCTNSLAASQRTINLEDQL
ncbi:melatonin receptor type 1B-B-like [Strongylocentrotus purpuratus]|uniref:G-protein coupled receptors family 1 profile domain-containing protein n=1 Tax=Strongylocentrotus purpuratus TaxID=7668 RepID=A0A7M7NLW4_STRPU|nr:melatonin receptor type 1B-B-like [Strongylocentrotus purpuratus]